MKKIIKKIPGVKKLLGIVRNKTKAREEYSFERYEYELNKEKFDIQEINKLQILNMLNYTKTSGVPYDANEYPAGYQTIEINGESYKGQRNPKERLKIVPFDFQDKNVLDIGSNQGGMLFEISDLIKSGVGIDNDYKMVNVANRICYHRSLNNLEFYVFDVDYEDLNVIYDLLPFANVDIVFLLSVCMWIENWEKLIKFTAQVTDNILFEANGTSIQQSEQVWCLESHYQHVKMLSEASDDDPKNSNRKLYLAYK